jgi:uncharacterized protein YacL
MKLTVWLVRMMFVVGFAAAAWYTGAALPSEYGQIMALILGLIVALLMVLADILLQRKSLIILVAATFGILIGALLEILVHQILNLTGALDIFQPATLPGLELLVMTLLCYLFVTVIIQTKDDFRMVIPYVRFAKEPSGPRPLVLDSSVIIDGRIADIIETRILDAPLIVPRFVLEEIQAIADAATSHDLLVIYDEMYEKLSCFGWSAAAVRGFIPPAVYTGRLLHAELDEMAVLTARVARR